jgi:hypothetical protein
LAKQNNSSESGSSTEDQNQQLEQPPLIGTAQGIAFLNKINAELGQNSFAEEVNFCLFTLST